MLGTITGRLWRQHIQVFGMVYMYFISGLFIALSEILNPYLLNSTLKLANRSAKYIYRPLTLKIYLKKSGQICFVTLHFWKKINENHILGPYSETVPVLYDGCREWLSTRIRKWLNLPFLHIACMLLSSTEDVMANNLLCPTIKWFGVNQPGCVINTWT